MDQNDTDARRQKRREEAMALLEGVRQAMSTREGRMLLRSLMDESLFLKSAAAGATTEVLNHMEGRRAVGAHLFSLLVEQNKKNIVMLMEDE